MEIKNLALTPPKAQQIKLDLAIGGSYTAACNIKTFLHMFVSIYSKLSLGSAWIAPNSIGSIHFNSMICHAFQFVDLNFLLPFLSHERLI